MCIAPQSFSELARDVVAGRWKDRAHWRRMALTGAWEGSEGTPADGCYAARHTGIVSLNAGKQLTVDPSKGPRAEAHDSWHLLLDALSNSFQICTLQETGAGGRRNERIVREIVACWSRRTGIAARVWITAGAGVPHAGGPAAGLATIVFGAWASRGRAARHWLDGRGLWVELQEGAQALTVGNVYGPQGSDSAAVATFFTAVAQERADAHARGCSTLVMGDFNARRALIDSASGAAPSDVAAAWFAGADVTDLWRSVHPQHPGFTRRPLGSAGSSAATRIDYIGLDSDTPQAAIAGTWLGPWGDALGLTSDHRPLAAQLHTDIWLGELTPTVHAAADLGTPFPPRHWFIATKHDEEEAALAVELKRLPRKLPRSAVTDAFALPEVREAVAAHAAAVATASGSLQWRAHCAVGTAISAALAPQIRPRSVLAMKPRSDGYLSDAANLRLRGLRKWHKRLRRHGLSLFQPTRPMTELASDWFAAIPEELWDIYTEAELHRRHLQEGAESAEVLWQSAIAVGLADHSTPPRHAHPPPATLATFATLDWLLAMLRVRHSSAKALLQRSAHAVSSAAEWRKRLLLASEYAAGRTGGGFFADQPPLQAHLRGRRRRPHRRWRLLAHRRRRHQAERC
jgi:exonuclease III